MSLARVVQEAWAPALEALKERLDQVMPTPSSFSRVKEDEILLQIIIRIPVLSLTIRTEHSRIKHKVATCLMTPRILKIILKRWRCCTRSQSIHTEPQVRRQASEVRSIVRVRICNLIATITKVATSRLPGSCPARKRLMVQQVQQHTTRTRETTQMDQTQVAIQSSTSSQLLKWFKTTRTHRTNQVPTTL